MAAPALGGPPEAVDDGDAPAIAMIMTHHPRVSYTFLAREIEGVEALGLRVLPIALNPPDGADLAGEGAAREQQRTLYIKALPKASALRTIASLVLRHPGALPRAAWLGVRFFGFEPGRLWRHLLHCAEASVVLAYCRRHGVRHIHAHFGGTTSTIALLAAELSRRSGPWADSLTWSFTLHGLDLWNDPEAALRYKAGGAAAVIGVSDFTRSQVLRIAHPEDWSRVTVVRSGIDIDQFPFREPQAGTGAARLVCVGRLAPEKGHLVLLDAVAQVRERGVDVRLVIIGDGPLRLEIERRAAGPELVGAVEVLGERSPDDVRAIVGEADVFCLASFSEGLPAAIVEAMALGVPVVSTAVGGVAEIVEDGVSGRCVPAGRADLLAGAIETTVLDLEMRRRFARAGRERARDNHDIKHTSRQLVDVLMRVATSRGGHP